MNKFISILLLIMTFQVAAQNLPATNVKEIMAIKDLDARIRKGCDYFLEVAEKDYANLPIYAQEMFVMAQKRNDKHMQALSLTNMAFANYVRGNESISLEYTLKALKLAEPLHNDLVMAVVKNMLSFIHGDQKKHVKLSHEAMRLYGKAKYYHGVMNICCGLGIYYYNLAQFDSAKVYFHKTEQLLTHHYNKTTAVALYTGLGKLHYEMKNPQLAKAYLKMLKDEAKDGVDPRWESNTYSILAGIKFHVDHDIDSAAYYAKKSIAAVENTSMKNLRITSAKLLMDIYKGRDDKLAMRYASIFIEETYKANDLNKLQQTQLMLFNEEMRQKSIADDELKKKQERQDNLQYAFIATGIITFFIFFLMLSQTVIVNAKWISFLAILALLLLFEFINLLIHPFLGNITHHSPILMLLAMVTLASLLIPLHHKLEHFIKHKLIEKNKAIRLAAAKKTIERLEND